MLTVADRSSLKSDYLRFSKMTLFFRESLFKNYKDTFDLADFYWRGGSFLKKLETAEHDKCFKWA